MPKVHFKLRPESQAAFVSCMFSLISALLLGVIYWPVLLFYVRGLPDGPESVRIVVFCCFSIALTLLYSIVTGIFASRTLTLPALFALPVSLLLVADVTGLRSTLLFFSFEDVLRVYRQPHPFFRGWWLFLGLTGLVILASALSYIKISFHRARSLAPGLLAGLLATLCWIACALLRLFCSQLPDYRQAIDGFSGRDLLYAILYDFAGLFFFLSVLVVLTATRKTLVGADVSDGAVRDPFTQYPADLSAQSEPAQTYAPLYPADGYAADYQTPLPSQPDIADAAPAPVAPADAEQPVPVVSDAPEAAEAGDAPAPTDSAGSPANVLSGETANPGPPPKRRRRKKGQAAPADPGPDAAESAQ